MLATSLSSLWISLIGASFILLSLVSIDFFVKEGRVRFYVALVIMSAATEALFALISSAAFRVDADPGFLILRSLDRLIEVIACSSYILFRLGILNHFQSEAK